MIKRLKPHVFMPVDDPCAEVIDELEAEIRTLEVKVLILQGGLEHYADIDNWICERCDNPTVNCDLDSYHRMQIYDGRHGYDHARQKLKEAEEIK